MEIRINDRLGYRLFLLLLVLVLALTVWPTPWWYQTLRIGSGDNILRINRITQKVESLTSQGWREVR